MEGLPHLSRRARERCLKRRAILDAAKATFAEKSYVEATIEEIAERAEFGKGTIYLYFKDGKREILQVLVEELFDEVHAHLEDIVEVAEASGGNARSMLESYTGWAVQYLVEQHDLFIVSMREVDRYIPQADQSDTVPWGRRYGDLVRLMSSFFDIAVQRGEMRPVDTTALSNVFFYAVRGYVSMLVDAGVHGTADASESASSAAGFLVSLFFEGVSGQPGT